MVEFYKYHGLGNDFIVIEGSQELLSTDEVVALCDRRRGVGADGILLVEFVAADPEPRVAMVVLNRDGSRPQMCGNGVRCVAAYARKYRGGPAEMVVESDAGPRRCRIIDDGERTTTVTVDMGSTTVRRGDKALVVDGRSFEYVFVDVGNPHAVIFEQPDLGVVDRVGEVVNDSHRAFDEGVNVEFVARRRDETAQFDVVVYERGVGRTRACGTGACAVAAAAWRTQRVDPDEAVTIHLPGGPLTIETRGGRLWMTGAAEEVFSGRWRFDSSDDDGSRR